MKVSCVSCKNVEHRLFDYEAVDFGLSQVWIDKSALVGFGNEGVVELEKEDFKKSELQVIKTGTLYEIFPVKTKKLWKIVKKDLFSPLSDRQFIKLGRKMFRVHTKIPSFSLKSLSPYLSDSQETCRICFQSSQQGDPLVSPCNCKGSIKFAHLTCFKNFIRPSIKIEKSFKVTKFTVGSLFCEISKCQVHRKLLKKTLIFGFLKNFVFTNPHLILEYFDKNKEYSVYVLEFDNEEEIIAGRSKSAGLGIFDVSVSRAHCAFRVLDGKAMVADLGSKYGTLISCGRGKVVEGMDETDFQMASRVLSFRIEKKSFKD